MEELYERLEDLKNQIKELEKFVFNKDVKIKLTELRIRKEELSRTLRIVEHL